MAGPSASGLSSHSGGLDGSVCFEQWLRDNGGNEELIGILKTNGFTSKLSLKNLDLTSPDASLFVDALNYGQKCLLRGLVKLLNDPVSPCVENPYTSGTSRAASLANATKSTSLKEKIGKMFHLGTSKKASDFEPSPMYSKVGKTGTKRKMPDMSSQRGKGPLKKKVKQMKLKVIALPKMSKHTPSGSYRDKLTYHVWINVGASEKETRESIVEVLGWQNPRNVEYLYAQGKNLRKAVLSDVENAVSWDMDTLRALMGSGALYVVKTPCMESSDSGSCSDCDVPPRTSENITVSCKLHTI